MEIKLFFLDLLMICLESAVLLILLSAFLPRRRGTLPLLGVFLFMLSLQLINRRLEPSFSHQTLFLSFLADCLASHGAFAGSLKKKLAVMASGYALLSAWDGLTLILLNLFFPAALSPVAMPQAPAVNIVILLAWLCLPLLLLLFLRYGLKQVVARYQSLIFISVPICIALLLAALFPTLEVPPHLIYIFAMALVCTLLVISMVFIYIHLTDAQAATKERIRLLEYAEGLHGRHYRELQAAFVRMEHTVHDIRRHLAHLEILHQAGRKEELDRYLGAVGRQLEPPVYTGNFDVDALLSLKHKQVVDLAVDLRVRGSLPKPLPWVDPVDIIALLGNALDNGLEECSRIPAEQGRWLDIQFTDEQGWGLMMENPLAVSGFGQGQGPQQKAKKIPFPLASKKSGLGHGFGMASMARIVEKYGGTMEIFLDAGRFRLHVMLPEPRVEAACQTAEHSAEY